MAKMIESAAARAQTPFKNAPFTDFTKPENRQAQAAALEQVKGELGRMYPLVIGGKKIMNEATVASVNPSQPEQVIGYFAQATVEQVEEAGQAAKSGFESWEQGPARETARDRCVWA